MVSMDELNNSLNSNPYLTEDIKDNLMELIVVFNQKFPDVDLNNLNNRLKDLKIIRGSRFLIKGTSQYNPIDNELLVSLVNINDNVDCKHVLMRELLNIIVSKGNYTGFNQDSAFEALNVGYTEILTNFLVGNECDEYEDEIMATNLIGKIIGNETLFQAYFTNNATLLMSAIY